MDPHQLARIADALMLGADALGRIALALERLTGLPAPPHPASPRAPEASAVRSGQKPRRPPRDACTACGVMFETHGYRTTCPDCYRALRPTRQRAPVPPPDDADAIARRILDGAG